ncbi:MAG: ketoacyl-ACP synthase III [Deltaproteobacteria bacterium]|nr:ketoacyl-ACP synthase III [Deltaproteobacteria bacterium]
MIRTIGMSEGHSRIHSVGYFVPERRVASETIERDFQFGRFGMPPGSLERITGIRERRVSEEEMRPSELAVRACVDALERGHLRAADVDVLIYAAVGRDYMEPATAHVIQTRLGADEAYVFDVSNACLSMMDGILIGDSLIAMGRARVALVCGGEPSGEALRVMESEIDSVKSTEEFRARFAMFTLGEAGAAVVLEAKRKKTKRETTATRKYGEDHGGGFRNRGTAVSYIPFAEAAAGFVAFEFASRGEHHELCTIQSDGKTPMLTDSRRLLREGIGLAAEGIDPILERSGWRRGDIDLVIPHQVSVGANVELMSALRLPEHLAHVVVTDFGNTASTTIPVTLALAERAGKLQAGMKVLLVGVGSGVSVGLATLIW